MPAWVRISFVSLVFMAGVSGAYAAGDADDLGEATGLADVPVVDGEKSKANEPSSSRSICSYRGNFTMAYNQVQTPHEGPKRYSFPDLALSLTGDCKPTLRLQTFTALRAGYLDSADSKLGLVDQVGVRFKTSDSTVIVVGKERNRRAPGLFVSPSDFIHTSENLPGVEQERSGVWLMRASAQSQMQTADLIILPVTNLRDNGMPEENNEPRGAVARYFRQFGNFDLNLAAGRVDETAKAGMSTQGFIVGSWRAYAEAGYERERTLIIRKKEHIGNYLAGTGYDGDKYSLRLEYFHNGFGLTKDEWSRVTKLARMVPPKFMDLVKVPEAIRTPFIRQDYAILSLTFLEIKDVVNANQTMIRSLEDTSWFALTRVEWLAGTRNVFGAIYKTVDRSDFGQYFLRPSDWELGLDWKWSF